MADAALPRPLAGRKAAVTGSTSGIGLAIVKSIAQLHGGSVSAENSADGVEFSMLLPL